MNRWKYSKLKDQQTINLSMVSFQLLNTYNPTWKAESKSYNWYKNVEVYFLPFSTVKDITGLELHFYKLFQNQAT